MLISLTLCRSAVRTQRTREGTLTGYGSGRVLRPSPGQHDGTTDGDTGAPAITTLRPGELVLTAASTAAGRLRQRSITTGSSRPRMVAMAPACARARPSV